MKKIIALLKNLPPLSDAFKRAIRTAIQTFVATFGVSLLGFFTAVQMWATTGGEFPAVNPLGKAALAAAVGAASGLVSYAINWAEDHKTWFPALLKPAPPALNPVPDAGPEAPPEP